VLDFSLSVLALKLYYSYMELLRAKEIAYACGGKLYGEDRTFLGFCTDSREIKEGEVFVALRGSKYDGHNFIHHAFSKGAVGVITCREVNIPKGKFAVLVEDTFLALRKIAEYKRKHFKGKVIGVVGSAGKTTTKEMIAFLLSKRGKVCKTPKNYNSQVGVPLSVANFEEDCHFWVVEMGASQKGDVKSLVELVKPQVRVITAIGEEHLETFGCLDDVIAGNGEVFEGMSQEDWAVIPQYVRHCYQLRKVITFGEGGDIQAKDISLTEEKLSFSVEGIKIELSVPSLALMENALCTLGVLKAIGYDWREMSSHMAEFKPVEQRFNLIKKEGLLIIDDTYNANPPSVRKALESLSMFQGYKIALLGDMLELGASSQNYHQQIGQLCAKLNIDECLFYGDEMLFAYQECLRYNKNCYHSLLKEEVIKYLKSKLRERTVLLIKGSRGMRMEEFLQWLTA